MITIDDNYIISIDPYCYTLKRKSTISKKTGEQQYSTIGYYSDIDKVLVAYGKQMYRDVLISKDFSLEDAIIAIKSSNDAIRDRIEEILHDYINKV